MSCKLICGETQNYEKRLNKIISFMSKLETNLNQKMIDEKYDFIERWLPARYTTSVNIILKEDIRKPAYIRKVKKERISDQKILDALYKVALLNKLQIET